MKYMNLGMRLLDISEVDQAMLEIGKAHPEVVIVNADLGPTTMSKAFSKELPERSYEVHIAEQNQMSFAAGMAHEGFVPYVFSRACFASMRACEQVRTDICYGRLPVRILAQGAGYASGISGATHCALEDVAIMNSVAELMVLEPSDKHMLALMVKELVNTEKNPQPAYIRFGEFSKEAHYDDSDFQIGKALVRREGADGTFIVSGALADRAVNAANRIAEELGAQIGVTQIHTVKPIDDEAVRAAGRTGRVVVAQDHNKRGGLGSIVADVLMQAGICCKFAIRGAPDRFVPLATPAFLYHENGYDADGLYCAMKELL